MKSAELASIQTLQAEQTTNDEQSSNDLTGILPYRKSKINSWDSWHLPGHKPKGENCGQFFYKGCLRTDLHKSYQVLTQGKYQPHGEFHNKAVITKHSRTCKKASCENCYESWAGREAHDAVWRIAQYQTKMKPIHVIISPSPADMDLLDFKSLRQKMYLMAKKVGIQGGLAIIHPFRSLCANCQKDKESCKCYYQQLEWYPSPHFHLIVLGWINYQAVAENYRQTQWIIKNLGVRKTLGGTISYQLSHAGVNYPEENEPYQKDDVLKKDGKLATISWFGSLSYNKMRIDKRPSEKCPICEEKLLELIPPAWFNHDALDLDKQYYIDAGGWSYANDNRNI